MDTLYLQLDDLAGPDDGAQAWRLEEGKVSPLGRHTFATLTEKYPAADVSVFIPSARCLFTHATLSAKQRRLASEALAWLIEEQAAEDVENLQVVAGEADAQGNTPLIAVAKDYLDTLMRQCREAGWRMQALLPDLMLLPVPADGWVLSCAVNPDGMTTSTLRTGMLAGASLEAAPELLLAAALKEQMDEGRGAPSQLQLLIMADDDVSIATTVSSWCSAHDIICVPVDAAEQDISARLTQENWLRHPASFLQNDFSGERSLLPRPLRIAAMFLLLAFSVQLVSEWSRYFYFRHQSLKAREVATATYRQLFPEERRITDLRRQMNAHLGSASATGNSLPVLTRIAEAMQGSGLNTQRVDFAAGTFTLDVEARGITEIDALKSRLEGQGLSTEIVSANAVSNGAIRGRLRVQENGA
ncbi:MAG: type II secretion system protein GspL [Moraxellaceae bacterium]|nr:type II secretion system protein GspL [Moraxellaceae bacterium]